MISKFQVTRAPVLNLRYEADRDGHVLPPECYIKFDPTKVPVVFDDASQNQVGWATLYRDGDTLYGDFRLKSAMVPASDALQLMRKLTPAVGFEIHDSYGKIFLMIRVTHILVTPAGNSDISVPEFGDKIRCLTRGNLN